MSTAIFVRSYNRDFLWLDYCARSIERYCKGFDEVVLVVPSGHQKRLNPDTAARFTSIHGTQDHGNGYLGQQITKLNAHLYTKCDQILFVDSDCIFTKETTPESYMRDGKPLLLRTAYAEFAAGEPVHQWRKATQHFIGGDVSHEWMRRIPLMHRRDVFEDISKDYPAIEAQVYKHGKFSEFNFVGEYVSRNCPERYTIADTGEPIENVAVQHWSWGGMSEGIQQKLERICQGKGSPVDSLEKMTHRNQIGELLNNLALGGAGVEVGVGYGNNAKEILSQWHHGKLSLVDPWCRWPGSEYIDHANKINFPKALKYCQKLLRPWASRCNYLREKSIDAVHHFADNSLDFAYIDGNHHEPSISLDLMAWWPKVRPGGIFGGHDFYTLDTPEYRCDVEAAVTKFAAAIGQPIHLTDCSSWWIQKPME